MEHIVAVGQYVSSHPLGIIIAIVVSYIIGMVWHGPLFGKMWMDCNNMPMPKKEDMKFSMMLPGLSANLVKMFFMCAVLGRTFQIVDLPNMMSALVIATIIWLPFTALVLVNNYAWVGKPIKLMVLDSAYELVTVWATAAILYATL